MKKKQNSPAALTQDMLALAEAAEAKARTDRDEAAARFAARERAFDVDDSASNREALRMAEEDAKRAERIFAEKTEALKSALRAHEDSTRKERLARYEAHKARATECRAKVEAAAAAVVEVDRMLDAAVLSVVRHVAEADAEFRAAEELAVDLGMTLDLDRSVERPAVDEARLLVTRVVTAARTAEHRDDASGWLARASDDWRKADLSARDMRQTAKWVDAQRREEAAVQAANLRTLAAMVTAATARPATHPGPRPGPRPLTTPENEADANAT